MSDITCVDVIEEHSNIQETCSDQWEMIRDTLINLKEIKISALENIQTTLKDNNKLLPEKSDLSKIRDLLLDLGDII